MAQRHQTQADSPAEGPTIALPNVVGFQPAPPPLERHERVRELRVEAFPKHANRDEMLRTYAATTLNPETAQGQETGAGNAIAALRQARDGATARAKELSEQLQTAGDTIYELTQNLELAQLERDLAIQRLLASQGECRALRGLPVAGVESLSIPASIAAVQDSPSGEGMHAGVPDVGECDRLRAQLDEVTTRSEIQIAALQAKLAASVAKRDSFANEDELEWHRREVAALQLELEGAREQLGLLSGQACGLSVLHNGTPEIVPLPEELGTTSLESAPFTILELGREHAEIEQTLAELHADTSRLELLEVLAERFSDCGRNAVAAGFPAVYRLASACADLAAWLRKTPVKIAGSMPLLGESCELLKRLFETGGAALVSDPAGASVYAVDNDEDNCECLVMALEKAAFQTRYATKADVAFGELADARVDLIVLDVDLGDSDGFNLHDLIRQIEHHENTPVIFVSGLLSTADRLAGLSGPPASFVAKPYNLNELLLKALCTVVNSRLDRLTS